MTLGPDPFWVALQTLRLGHEHLHRPIALWRVFHLELDLLPSSRRGAIAPDQARAMHKEIRTLRLADKAIAPARVIPLDRATTASGQLGQSRASWAESRRCHMARGDTPDLVRCRMEKADAARAASEQTIPLWHGGSSYPGRRLRRSRLRRSSLGARIGIHRGLVGAFWCVWLSRLESVLIQRLIVRRLVLHLRFQYDGRLSCA
jgi:hypothetical protein